MTDGRAFDPDSIVDIQIHDISHEVKIHIADHGPGIFTNELSRAFHKSAREATESQPGVGLGLALSRRLSREQGGDLICEALLPQAPGARFILRLPRS
jgi:K+-sensing histidine kinase KdpD